MYKNKKNGSLTVYTACRYIFINCQYTGEWFKIYSEGKQAVAAHSWTQTRPTKIKNLNLMQHLHCRFHSPPFFSSWLPSSTSCFESFPLDVSPAFSNPSPFTSNQASNSICQLNPLILHISPEVWPSEPKPTESQQIERRLIKPSS